MGKATEYLLNLIQKQIDAHGIVVWFDPEGIYAGLAERLPATAARVVQFNGSYFALRRQVDDLMNDIEKETPPRMVIYVPAERTSTQHALDEFILAGVVMQPDGESPALTTKLEVIARHALKLPSETLEKVCEQIRQGSITSLSDLDQVAEQSSPDLGALTLVFKAGGASEIAIKFLTDSSFDRHIVAKSAVPTLAAFLNQSFDAGLPDNEGPADLRARFGRHLLITEFLKSLAGAPPEPLATVRIPASPKVVDECVQLVRTWRNRRDLQESYTDAAERVQREFGLANLPCDWEALREVETFPSVEDRLQTCIADALTQQPADALIALAEKRQAGMWVEVKPDLRILWTLIATAGRLLRETEYVQTAISKSPPKNAAGYIEQYVQGEHPWCQMDTEHRLLERLATTIDFDSQAAHGSVERLLARARQEYSKVVDLLARKFVRAYADAGFDLGGFTRQSEVFARYVAPSANTAKTAYVLVDALRFEMARDLVAGLDKAWRSELSPALATAPTITAVGMGGLLPDAERGITLVDAGGGKLAIMIGSRVLKDRKDRIKWLGEKVNGLLDVKLESLVPAGKSTRDAIRSARFIVVTSQEIDWLGEADSIGQAREFMDSALDKLGRAFRVLADLGVERIVLAADHGYIFAEELKTDATLEAPGGQTADLHRRVWIGKGGHAYDEVLRVPARQLGLGSDLELATPYGLACFTAGGNKAYLHGGLSLQELVIPVVVIQPAVGPAPVSAQIEWELVPGSKKLTTGFFSATVRGVAKGMFELHPPRVRVEIRARNKPVSLPVAASYGYQEATGEVELRARVDSPTELEPNTITVRITDDVDQKTVAVVLLNAETGETLKKIDIENAIAM